jgi:hypothetical protein
VTASTLFKEFFATFVSFFKKKQALIAILFMLLYRFPEAQLVKLVTSPNPDYLRTAYELGITAQILPEFDSYGNRCLEDTFLKGMPEFFKWYDVKFEPQNTIVTLDYPVLKDLSGDAGVDRIFGFLRCLRLEQRFLRRFPKEFVQKALDGAGAGRNGAAENLCGIVLETALKRLLGEGDAAAYLALAMEDAVVRLNYAGLKDTADNG